MGVYLGRGIFSFAEGVIYRGKLGFWNLLKKKSEILCVSLLDPILYVGFFFLKKKIHGDPQKQLTGGL